MIFRSCFGMLMALAAVACSAQTSEGFFDSKGVRIHFATAGEGEAIVLIHGWLSDSTMWGRAADGSTNLNTVGMEGFKIIAIDCRGHGKSGKPHDVKKYGQEMAADVVRLLDHLNVKRAHLVGYSMGAFIAGRVVATHPDRVISAIYGGQAPLVAGFDSHGSTEVDAFAKAVKEGKGMGPYIIAITPTGRPRPTPAQAENMAKFMFAGKDVEALSAAGRSFSALEVTWSTLSAAKVPSLFIYGSNEPPRLKTRVEAMQQKLTNVEVKVIPDADHMTTLTKPLFGSSIVDFIHRHQESGPK